MTDNPNLAYLHAHLSEDELARYRANPEEIEQLLDRERIQQKMVWSLLTVAFALVALSKIVPFFFEEMLGPFVSEVLVDLVFEMGAAIMGAVATLYFIERAGSQQFKENQRLYRALKAELDRGK